MAKNEADIIDPKLNEIVAAMENARMVMQDRNNMAKKLRSAESTARDAAIIAETSALEAKNKFNECLLQMKKFMAGQEVTTPEPMLEVAEQVGRES